MANLRGIYDRQFFNRLAAAGVRFRMVDDPLVIAGVVSPIVVVGAAGLFADGPVEAAILAEVQDFEEALRIIVGGFGLAELQRARRLTDANAKALAPFLLHPDTLDFLLTPEQDIHNDGR